MHRRRWIIVLVALSAGVPALVAQEPATSPGSSSPATERSSTSKSKRSHANGLLLRGTVFNQHGLAMGEVKLRIRRANEKKSRWEAYTNSRENLPFACRRDRITRCRPRARDLKDKLER